MHDFQGPYYVGVDHFMVGRVTKYVSNYLILNLLKVLETSTSSLHRLSRTINAICGTPYFLPVIPVKE